MPLVRPLQAATSSRESPDIAQGTSAARSTFDATPECGFFADFGRFPAICTFSYTVDDIPFLFRKPPELVLSPKEVRIVLVIA